MKNDLNHYDNSRKSEFGILALRYFSFWPFFVLSIIIGFFSAFFYLRYSTNIYQTKAVIEIIDKSQDSEMALPTSMTIFNRSMINLDNEFGRLGSYDINKNVISSSKFNVRYFTKGVIKDFEEHKSQFFEDFEIKFNVPTDSIVDFSEYLIEIQNNKMSIKNIDEESIFDQNYNFKGLSTFEYKHSLPFDLKINKISKNPQVENIKKSIRFEPFEYAVNRMLRGLNLSQYSYNRGNSNFLKQGN